MRKYDCATAIVIFLLIHPRMWETGPSSFSSISLLDFLSSTWTLFTNYPVNGGNKEIKVLLLLVKVLNVLIPFLLFPPNKKSTYWLLVVGGAVAIAKSNAIIGVSYTNDILPS